MNALMTIFSIAIGALSAVLVVLAWLVTRRAVKERARFERWLRGNLLIMRVECYHSPEALSVINSLERALPVLAPIDGEGLGGHLARIRRDRECRLLAAAGSMGVQRIASKIANGAPPAAGDKLAPSLDDRRHEKGWHL